MADILPTNNFDRFFLGYMQSVRGREAWYYNQRFLGRGGNGTAFLVTCSSGPNYGVQLVLKVFHKISNPRRREAFLQEISHLRKFDHPAIVKLYDEGEYTVQDRRYPFAVMEYVPSNVRYLLNLNRINRLQAIRIILNCLSALNCIHTASTPIIHRDIKPENILISEIGAKIADFGLAKEEELIEVAALPEDEEEPLLLQTQWPAMPRSYRTPELVKRAKEISTSGAPSTEITPASDIFQIGTVFYELLTGFNPQKFCNEITDDIQLDIREIRGVCGSPLTNLIKSTLDPNPLNRPTAAQCIDELNWIHRNFCQSLHEVTAEFI